MYLSDSLILRLSYKFAAESIQIELDNSEGPCHSTILAYLSKSTDPVTGQKLGMTDLVINATLLLYSPANPF